jgi:hypothetical protein
MMSNLAGSTMAKKGLSDTERVYEELVVRRSSLDRYEDIVRLGFVS